MHLFTIYRVKPALNLLKANRLDKEFSTITLTSLWPHRAMRTSDFFFRCFEPNVADQILQIEHMRLAVRVRVGVACPFSSLIALILLLAATIVSLGTGLALL